MKLTRLTGLYPPFGGAAPDGPPPPPAPRRFPTLVLGRPTPRPRAVVAAWARVKDL